MSSNIYKMTPLEALITRRLLLKVLRFFVASRDIKGKGWNPSDIAQIIGDDKSNTYRVVQVLFKRGLIARTKTKNKRIYLYSIKDNKIWKAIAQLDKRETD